MCICISTCICSSLLTSLLFLLLADHFFFFNFDKMLHCIKSWVSNFFDICFFHHSVQLMVEAGRRKHITIILHITEKKSSIVWWGSRRNSSQKEVTETPWITEKCTKHFLIFYSAKYNYMFWGMMKKEWVKKIENWAFKLDL